MRKTVTSSPTPWKGAEHSLFLVLNGSNISSTWSVEVCRYFFLLFWNIEEELCHSYMHSNCRNQEFHEQSPSVAVHIHFKRHVVSGHTLIYDLQHTCRDAPGGTRLYALAWSSKFPHLSNLSEHFMTLGVSQLYNSETCFFFFYRLHFSTNAVLFYTTY